MSTTLCESFRTLAFRTFDLMGRARKVGHQPLEETLTDINILELKERHPTEIYSEVFNKRDEGRNGADWQWWLTNEQKTSWLGLRVQAKILHLKSDTFAHLHYKSGKPKVYQLEKLKLGCVKEGLIPLYCFYTHQQPDCSSAQWRCGSFGSMPESFGCALAALSHVELLQGNKELNGYGDVIAGAIPWHCLVCCEGFGGGDLPSRAWQMLQRQLNIPAPETDELSASISPHNVQVRIGPRPEPPAYVRAIVDGQETTSASDGEAISNNEIWDRAPPDIGGILILQGCDGG